MKTHSLVPSAHILLYKCLPKHLRQGFTCLCWEMLNCHSVFFASYLLMRQEARHRGFLSGFSIFFLFCCVLTKQCFSLPIPLNRMRTCYPQSKTLSTVRSNDTKPPWIRFVSNKLLMSYTDRQGRSPISPILLRIWGWEVQGRRPWPDMCLYYPYICSHCDKVIQSLLSIRRLWKNVQVKTAYFSLSQK